MELKINKNTQVHKSIFSAVLITASAFASAQTSDKILSRLSYQAKDYENIEASYNATLVDLKNDYSEDLSGHILIGDNGFNLDLGDFVIISDGTTVWSYDVEANECYIDDAELLIEEGMDPSKIFTIWEDDFNTELKGEVDINGKTCTQINLYPIDSDDKSFHTIKLFVHDNGKTLDIVKTLVKGREGSDTEYIVKEFKTGIVIPDGSFQFNESNYPEVEIIDNRF